MPPPPISIKGEWGILQREARRGATYGRAKTTSHELKWSTVASKIHLHNRSNFHRAHRCKTQKPPPLHNPNFKFRMQKAKPKKWRDLAKLQDLNNFVSNELQKIEQITADISPLRTISGHHTVTQTEDCRVAIGCSQNSNCYVSPPTSPPTPTRVFHANISQIEKEMEDSNNQLQNEIKVLDHKIT